MALSKGFYWAVGLIALAAGILVALIAHMRALSREDLLYVPKSVAISPAVELLQRYVRIDTSNPPGNESAGAEFLLDLLRSRGIEGELIESAPGRGNVYARIRGKNRGGGLMLMHHIDVVPAEREKWSEPPFDAKIKLNMIYGRGTLDMKGIGICDLLAFIDVARSGKQPDHDLVFLAVADEEKGGELGTRWLLRHRPEIFDDVRYAINEGGITEVVREEVRYFGVEIGSKQFVRLKLSAPSRGALQKARIALEPLFSPKDAERVLPEVREYFRAIAPTRLELPELYADLDRTVAEGRFWNLPASYRGLATTEVGVSGVELSKDGRATADAALLILPDETAGDAVAGIEARVRPYGVGVRIVEAVEASRLSSMSSPFYREIGRAVHDEYGEDVHVGPVLLPYSATDSRYLRQRGIDAYGLWPFPVDYFQSSGVHGVDERVRLDWYDQGVDLTRRLVFGYLFDARDKSSRSGLTKSVTQ